MAETGKQLALIVSIKKAVIARISEILIGTAKGKNSRVANVKSVAVWLKEKIRNWRERK
jgi:hypothetical protein